MDKTTYYAAAEGFIEGKYRKVGDKIGVLSEARAKYPLMAGQITDTAPIAASPDTPPKSAKKESV